MYGYALKACIERVRYCCWKNDYQRCCCINIKSYAGKCLKEIIAEIDFEKSKQRKWIYSLLRYRHRKRSTELRMRLTMLLKPCRFLLQKKKKNATDNNQYNTDSVERGSVCACVWMCDVRACAGGGKGNKKEGKRDKASKLLYVLWIKCIVAEEMKGKRNIETFASFFLLLYIL